MHKKTEDKKKEYIISVRMTRLQESEIKKKADSQGLSISSYFLMLGLHDKEVNS